MHPLHPLFLHWYHSNLGLILRDAACLQIHQTMKDFEQWHLLNTSTSCLYGVLSTAGCSFSSILKVHYYLFLWVNMYMYVLIILSHFGWIMMDFLYSSGKDGVWGTMQWLNNCQVTINTLLYLTCTILHSINWWYKPSRTNQNIEGGCLLPASLLHLPDKLFTNLECELLNHEWIVFFKIKHS